MDKYCYYCMNKTDNNGICEDCRHTYAGDTNVQHLPAGTILMDRYLLGRVLGEGGFGITYIGKDLKLDMTVAIKEYFPNGYVNRINSVDDHVSVNGKKNEDFFRNGKEKFIREARILAKFSGNKSIVDVRDFFECNNTAYIVMEYIQGITLRDYIKANGNIPADEMISKMMPIFFALRAIHKNDLIHRDISPDNIMVLDDGSLKLMDFGAARKVNFEDKKTLSVVLKHGYAPEEQYRSKGEQGPWTDIYAACATIYKCITGVTPDESTERVFDDNLQPPSALGITISPQYEQVLMKGLAVRQKDRYQNADELIQAFSISDNTGVSVIHVADLSNTADSDDKTEYYEEIEKTDDKTEDYEETDDRTDRHSEDGAFEAVEDGGNKEETGSTGNNNKRIKRVILIAIPSLVVICGLIIVLVLLFSNNNNLNITADTVPNETISQPSNQLSIMNETKNTSSFVEETTQAEKTTVKETIRKAQNPLIAKLSETSTLRKQQETTLSAGIDHIVGIKSDGTTMAKGFNGYSECNISGWSDIIAISAGEFFTLGLKSDGTVVTQGYPYDTRVNVGDWTDVIAISAGASHSVGLKSDGTVVATGFNASGQCNVGDWKDIVAISADCNQTIGLKSDGTVVAAGENESGQCTVGGWKNIVAISAGWWHTVAVKSDGTVVAMGANDSSQCKVNNWKDIVAVSAGNEHTVGLKSDGTVIAVGKNDSGQCDVSEWKDIVAISARNNYTVGLKADGTVVFTGDNDKGYLDAQGWENIQLPYYLK